MNKSLYKTAFHLIRNYHGEIATRNEIKRVCEDLNIDYEETVDSTYRECRNAFYNIARVTQKGMKMTPAAYESFLVHGMKFITKDHPIGRTTSSLEAFRRIKSGEFSLETIDVFVKWIETQCQTIYTLKSENQALKKYQTEKYKDLSNEERYFMAGLIEKPCSSCFKEKPNLNTFRSNNTMYIICGIEYTAIEACEKFNITKLLLNSRCDSKAKKGKYTEWHRKKENQ